MAARIIIDGRPFEFFNNVSIDLKFGQSASTFQFSAYFDPDNSTHRRIFRPLSYQEVVIEDERGLTLLTGTILNHNFERTSRPELSTLSGYSKTGVLSDCVIPKSQYPLEYNGLTYQELAEKLITPFDIELEIQDFGVLAPTVIDAISASGTETVFGFLNNIAIQRNLVLTNTFRGNLLLTRANTNAAPIATFRESLPVTRINLAVNGQNIHNPITALKQADIERDDASEFLVENSLVRSFRPTLQNQTVGNDVTIEDVARNIRSSELRNLKLIIETDRWAWLRNQTPETMQPGFIIAVISPSNYIFELTRFFVESVQLNRDETTETAVLTCVLPQVYDNTDPANIF